MELWDDIRKALTVTLAEPPEFQIALGDILMKKYSSTSEFSCKIVEHNDLIKILSKETILIPDAQDLFMSSFKMVC